MIFAIDLSGRWDFCLDKEKDGLRQEFYKKQLTDSIQLPTTVSEARKGTPSEIENTYFLTDPYLFEGYTWYSRIVNFPDAEGKEFFLLLERTRTSHVWVDDNYAGSLNSLCATHRYRLTPLISKAQHRLTIMVDNTSCPVKGGHMTSQDTQTNWNGIVGEISIAVCKAAYLTDVKLYPDAKSRLVHGKVKLTGAKECKAVISVSGNGLTYPETEYQWTEGENTFTYALDEKAELWSEHTPKLYTLNLELLYCDTASGNSDNAAAMVGQAFTGEGEEGLRDLYSFSFGLRAFNASDRYFEINGRRTFLRGKHDGLIFPLTGYAPMDTDSWLKVFATAKSYGVNHYRFHTCCPPEAAFTAADMLGIYLQPELPFWGTVTEEGEKNHDEQAQQYLIEEGYRILDQFGNHPSFVMMSLGNELWGSKNRLNEILGNYKNYDNRHLYTQGSNNFQFVPCILENDDFFSGVRLSRDRLFRGSYAMCDAPQGHIQTKQPDTVHNYDSILRPESRTDGAQAGGDILIQYGTGMKTVKAEDSEELIPMVPVVSHEIGQYAMYPDYSEIEKYTGVLKARNFEVFRRRLEKEGMLEMAEKFFKASGRFAAECYKAEIETALRSNELAGFQLLDLQDFAGQGTALVGILNALLESKGLLTEEEWREFCSDTVILAELPKMIFQAGECVRIGVKLAQFHPVPIIDPKIIVTVTAPAQPEVSTITLEKSISGEYAGAVFELCDLTVELPKVPKPCKLQLEVSISGTKIKNHYDLWVYPEQTKIQAKTAEKPIVVTDSTMEAVKELAEGKNVLLFPKSLSADNSIEGTYCTDFWCYPMFRSISESMNKPVPVGTLGLLVDNTHPIFKEFPTEYYSTAVWYDIISNSRSLKLNGTKLEPLAWTIDNFERNDRLGLLFEVRVGEGKLVVCTSDLRILKDSLPAGWLFTSLVDYMQSEEFRPKFKMEIDVIQKILNS